MRQAWPNANKERRRNRPMNVCFGRQTLPAREAEQVERAYYIIVAIVVVIIIVVIVIIIIIFDCGADFTPN